VIFAVKIVLVVENLIEINNWQDKWNLAPEGEG